jgi:hypothetical protein
MIDILIVPGSGGSDVREYILRNPNTLVYAEPRFLELVAEHLGADCSWIVARRKGVISGVLPFLVKEGPLGPVFNSLAYYGSNGGVIQVCRDDDSKAALVDAFYNNALTSKAISATIISNPMECDSWFYDAYVAYDFRDERIGQITHFPLHAEDFLASFENPRPRNIRRAIKEGVVIEKKSVDALEFLYKTHEDNMTAIGGNAKKKSFFERISTKMLAEDWAVYMAILNGRPVAAVLLFYFNKTVEYFTPVIVEEYRNTQSLSLTIYEAMLDAKAQGFKNWNWGGTWLSQGGVYDFKKRWGTSEYRYFYYTRVMEPKLFSYNPKFFLDHYFGFYVIPFNSLVTV